MNEQTERLGSIIRIIANNPGITLNQLQAELERQGVTVTERTIAKDVLALKQEYRLLPDKDRLRHGYYLQNICTLSAKELDIVLDAMHMLGARLNDTHAQNTLDRLARLSGAEFIRTRSIRQHDIYRKKGSSQSTDQLLLVAIRTRKPVSIVYKTPRLSAPQNVKAYPLLLIFHERGWYCIMRNLKEQYYAPRRVDRILECKLLQDAAPNDNHIEDLKQAQYLISCGWGMTFPHTMDELQQGESEPEIVVRFDRTVADYITEATERHPRSRIRHTKDGTGDIEFRIRLACDTKEFQYWVRSFGAKAWFVAPTALVERERAEVRRMSARYGI